MSCEAVPFTIRGHHLHQFELLIKRSGWDPKLSPTALVYLSLRVYADFQRSAKEGDAISQAQASYATDVVGFTSEEKQLYRDRLTKIYETFLQLQPDDPLDLVMRPDNVCGACIRGDHCRNTRNAHNEEVFSFDRVHLDSFLRYITEHPHVQIGETTIVEETYDFQGIDAGQKLLKRIRTTAGTVKNVLATSPLPWQMTVDLYFPTKDRIK